MTISSLKTHRQQFPALTNKAYFNYGGQGPLAQISMDAIFEGYKYMQSHGPFSGKVNQWQNQETQLTRHLLATELGISPETLTFTENVTVGCNIALWGIDWQPGDHLLISDCEHPGILAIIQEIQRRFYLEVSFFPLRETLNQNDPVGMISEYLKPHTRLLVISHILWNTGQVLPLTEIVNLCHNNYNTKVLVDAAQSVGVLPINLTETGVDFYAFTGHKWFCGPDGLGGLYVSTQSRSELSPTFIGWRSIIGDEQGKPISWTPDGKRYEVATSAYPLYAALRHAIALHHQWGTATERYQQICQNSQYLWQKLAEIPQIQCLKTSPPEAGLVSFQLTNGKSHKSLVNTLENQGIFLRTLLDPNCVRACVHYFTLSSEIDQLIDAINQFIAVS
ncbi:aminotransferase class V-fold PLP-dependent enzyme [Planktothrix agardhii]|jgi:L-cysteine/cystine lyase|uniref:aminotransferase class V-fold PLP-dependent enzyme n=1 Tax=Planktothrix agardhii TaxID=1160 RepID=UPI001A279584|nr:aminotransferase class V-fold PLP-dependent enzyme [Planktothrix agardhii]MCF3607304.1 aminotransferase class V-fold PLP-dependent enzyme [Planktothrix agardhii 1033]MBG0746979.1 aminotransferase class V-fold PLP-dependent enzyme [Planktothrix agardhii KL2]MCB8751494.1 aminotransferase class V-fold PLP-dependent enzyme [Planktothrix agardhii 1810]MCB8751837.1 aminotransferase class V-fold PLP-dependent enzyme [Planktothrix agardhii 1810]MCB8760336.1 aminotransferase class V-fold PLP-depende